jgi:hypothetical protein
MIHAFRMTRQYDESVPGNRRGVRFVLKIGTRYAIARPKVDFLVTCFGWRDPGVELFN